MRKTTGGILNIVVAGIILFSASGCAALLVGAAAGVGGYAWVSGALVKEYSISTEKLYQASRQALKALNIVVIEERSDRLSALIHSKLADGRAVKLDIDSVTERTAKVRIRVGVFGDKGKSEMIMEAIDKAL